VRDLLQGEKTYSELAAADEKIPTNILAERLKRLENAGVLARRAYQERPTRYAYQLTPPGRELGPVLLAIVRWGAKHIPGTQMPPRVAARARKPSPSES
jgi:DNA-binding HxlR family transcriptional regulator